MERMAYPVLIEGLLQSLVAEGALRSPDRVTTLIRQLVDLTSGVLIRAADASAPDEIRAELRANVDLFCDGALVPTPGPASAPAEAASR